MMKGRVENLAPKRKKRILAGKITTKYILKYPISYETLHTHHTIGTMPMLSPSRLCSCTVRVYNKPSLEWGLLGNHRSVS